MVLRDGSNNEAEIVSKCISWLSIWNKLNLGEGVWVCPNGNPNGLREDVPMKDELDTIIVRKWNVFNLKLNFKL